MLIVETKAAYTHKETDTICREWLCEQVTAVEIRVYLGAFKASSLHRLLQPQILDLNVFGLAQARLGNQ